MVIQPSSNPAATAGTHVIYYRPKAIVYTKDAWDGDWQVADYLEAQIAIDCAAPTIPSATFLYHAGMVKREDQNDFSEFDPVVELRDQFVQIKIAPAALPDSGGGPAHGTPYTIWVGRFYADSIAPAGTDNGQNADQVLTAYGLQIELDRASIRGSYATNDGSNAFRIDTQLAFNEQFVQGLRDMGNRSFGPCSIDDDQCYVLSDTRDSQGEGIVWSVLDIINYLLTCYGPDDINFTVGGQTDAIENLYLPRVAVHHHTVYQAIEALLDRRGGLGWCLRTSGDGNVELHVYTVFDQDVTVGDAVIKHNPQAASIDLSNRGAVVKGYKVDYDSSTHFGKIIVGGQMILSCFSASFADGTLTEGWTNSSETAYLAAKDHERATDKFCHVYTTFLIPSDWDWSAGNGTGGAQYTSSPQLDPLGNLTQGDPPARNWGQRLLRSIPVKKPDDVMGEDVGVIRSEYREPFVLVYDIRHQHFVYAHKLNGQEFGTSGAHIRLLDNDFGIEVKFAANHMLALNHMSWGTDGNATPSEWQPIFDYEKMIATVAVRTDRRLEVAVTIQGGDPSRVLQIDVEDAELWYICPGTVLDVTNGNLVRQEPTYGDEGTPPGKAVRNDAPRLRQIAALAQTWYSKPRNTLTLEVWDIWAGYQVGSIVKTINDEITTDDVNTVVSEIRYDLKQMETRIRTHYTELDFKSAAGKAGASTLR